MPSSSSLSFRATAVKHYDRGVTLVFGSDGQVSLLGFNDGIPTQPPGVLPTVAASDTGALTPGTRPSPTGSSFVSPIPNLEATATSLASTSSFASTSTFGPISSSLASSGYNPSSTTTDTDTFLPTIPTIDYPTPNPTTVSEPKDHGVGAPFYLAIVLASISFVGCVAAFIAWCIRSRARKRDLEQDDPWHRRDSLSDAGSPLGDNGNGISKGAYVHVEAQTRPYYLPASIVRKGSPNLLAVPHMIPAVEGGISQNTHAGTTPDGGTLDRVNDQRLRNGPSSAASFHARPGTERLQTGLSVQESTRTLGRLRVANRAPGDFTSGDEGGMNIPRTQNSVRVTPAATYGGPNPAPARESIVEETRIDKGDRSTRGGDAVLEPPGPATMSWSKRMDTIPALRRTRRRAPEATIQTYKNPIYGGYWHPTSDTTWQAPDAVGQEEDGKKPPLDPLGWKSTLKSSFWQAVDVMTGNRPSESGPSAADAGGGSRFTPAPQRVSSRRSPVSPTRSIGDALTDTRTTRSQGTEIEPESTFPDITRATPRTIRASSRASSPWTNKSSVPHLGKDTLRQIGSPPARVSHLNQDLATSPHRRQPNPPRADTGSVYSTDSAAARANLRKYGYAESIPSTWSALIASRSSQLELSRSSLPLSGPTPSSSPGPGSIAPSQLTLESSLVSGSASVRTRTMTTVRSETDNIISDTGTLRDGDWDGTATASSVRSVSRGGTVRSGRSLAGAGATPFPSTTSSTTSSMLSRKKGVVTRRKRPRPPARAPSTASSIQSVESGLSVREMVVRRALLERRKRVKGVGSSRGHDDDVSPTHSHDVDILAGNTAPRGANA